MLFPGIEQEKRTKEEEERRQEEQILSTLNEEQKIEYFASKKRAVEQEEAKKMEEHQKQHEELKREEMDAKKAEALEAQRKLELEMRLSFLKSLHQEAELLGNSHSISRSFVFSYYDMLHYLDKKIYGTGTSRVNGIGLESLSILKRPK